MYGTLWVLFGRHSGQTCTTREIMLQSIWVSMWAASFCCAGSRPATHSDAVVRILQVLRVGRTKHLVKSIYHVHPVIYFYILYNTYTNMFLGFFALTLVGVDFQQTTNTQIIISRSSYFHTRDRC